MIFKLPDTGQTRCYDSKGTIIVRPKEGEEFYGQNGCYIINPMSFTKMDAHRNILNDTATWEDEFRIVLDNNTGLMWEEKSKVLGDINYFENKYTFEEAKNLYIEKLNDIRYGGYEDWRLPSREELRSIVDYSIAITAIDKGYFSNCLSDYYWTDDTYEMEQHCAWTIFFGIGTANVVSKLNKRCVRAVRGGYTEKLKNFDNDRFKDNGDGTITDTVTRLMWQKGYNEPKDWYSAIKQCKSMKIGGFDDWRLPNIKELSSIVNLNYENNSWIKEGLFEIKKEEIPYFTSTTFEKTYTWVINFKYGYDSYFGDKEEKLNFRACRSIDGKIDSPRIFKLPHSGQKACYDFDGSIIPIQKKESILYGQDGNIVNNPLSYTKLRTDFKEIDKSAQWKHGVRMILDNNTGLVWEYKSPNPYDINYKENKYTWNDAKAFVEMLNHKLYGGFNDWRMPTREELRTIVCYNNIVPTVDDKYFEDCYPEFYWCDENYTKKKNHAWGIYFGYGNALYYSKDIPFYCRAVRRGFNKDFGKIWCYSYQDNGDGTITDNNTNLMWAKGECSEMTYEEALKYCKELNLAGHSGWRLPNIKELATLIDISYKDETWYDEEYFPHLKTKPSAFYLSSTTFNGAFLWGVNFEYGYDDYFALKKTGKYNIRPVRNIG